MSRHPGRCLWREVSTLTAYSLLCALLGGVLGYSGALWAHRPARAVVVHGWVAPGCGEAGQEVQNGR